MSNFDLDAFLPYQLAVLSARVSRAISSLYKDKFGISVPEWRVVAHLSQAGSVSVREIHQRVDMDKSKVSRAATRLETSGYISKRVNGSDRRLVELALTQKGHDMVAKLTPIAQKFEHDFLKELGQDAPAFRASLQALVSQKAD